MTNGGFELIRCVLCDSDRHDEWCTKEFSQRIYRLVKCQECGLIFVNPQPTKIYLRKLYTGKYFSSDDATKVGYVNYMGSERKWRENVAEKNLIDVNAILRKSRSQEKEIQILDIGCACGYFLKKAKERGWAVKGVEVSKYAAKIAANEFGLDVFCGNVEDAAYSRPIFNVVTMFDVLEHIPNPSATIVKIKEILKDNGLLIFDSPDIESKDAVDQGKDFWLIKEDHLIYYSIETLRKLLANYGFEIVEHSKRKWNKNKYLFEDSESEGSHLRVIARKVSKDSAEYS